MGRSFPIPDPLPLEEQRGQSYPELVKIMQRLLASDGCPWDREQTLVTLRKYVLEEACEVIDAVDSGDPGQLVDELGDLALQVAFMGELGRKQGTFGPDDIVRAIILKLVRRHPHVFGDVQLETSDEVLANWAKIKEMEKPRGVLTGIPRSLPALQRAQKIGDKVSRVGFDWPDGQGSREKVTEELAELDAAFEESPERAEEELGDLLFALVNLARHRGIDAEAALRRASDKFAERFAHVEARVRETRGGWPLDGEGKPTRGIALEVLDGFWNEAKERGK